MRMTGRDWVLLLALSLLWGGAFFFSKIAVAEIGPLTTAAGRVSLAAVVLLAAVRLGGHRMPVGWSAAGAFLLMGLINNAVPFSLIFWGQTRIDSSLAAILNATTPVWAVLAAHLLTSDDRLTPARILGILVSLAGVVVLIGPAALDGITEAGWGMLAVLMAGLSYALAGLYGRRFKALPVQVAAAGMLTGSTVLMIPAALVVEQPWTYTPGLIHLAAVGGLALLSTALAYLLYFRLLRSAGPTNTQLVTFLIPVSALCLGVLVLGERPEPQAFLGMALIFAGLAVIDGRLAARLRQRRAGSSRAGG
ncbi:DMT family transporter [Caenispirillum salinarum]|uniref:DMT family transporter n=1 Tax=Caenispirillum salinarum TaxID=859058 RepID=UPI0038510832